MMNYMVPIALDIAGAILIGNAIGTGSERLAKHYYKWSLYMALLIAFVTEIILIGFRDQIIYCFTDSQEVIETIQYVWPAFCTFAFFDIMAAIASSAIWAAGLMQLGAIVAAISYWPVGILISSLMAFKADLGLAGLWLGPTFSCLCILVSFIITVSCIDWNKLIDEATIQRAKDAESKSIIHEEDCFKQV
jgi:multidrug resistance protein, MATE family